MRVIGRIRLSNLTDHTTNPERHREAITAWAAANGHEIVGWAEDLDVSGSLSPFDTPGLGPWLTDERKAEWDILAAVSLDRFGRRAIPLSRLFGWVMDNDKTLVCIKDSIDLSTWVGRLIATVIAGVAEGELEAITERNRSAKMKLREVGRWPGGRVPYGYKTVKRPEGGYKLGIDEESSGVLLGIIDDVISGTTIWKLTEDLNATGLLSPADYHRHVTGKKTRGGKWEATHVKNILTSRWLLGQMTHNGVTVRDETGEPVQYGPPLITQERFNDLQAVIQARSRPQNRTRERSSSPTLGVALCKGCKKSLRMVNNSYEETTYRYYRCPTREHGQSIPAEWLEQVLEETFLDELGDSQVHERVFVPGTSNEAELTEAVTALEELTNLVGTVSSTTARERLMSQIRAVDAKIAELEQQPASEPRTEYRPTGVTYREVWESSDTQQRRALLLKSGITLEAMLTGRVRNSSQGSLEFHLKVPEALRERMSV